MKTPQDTAGATWDAHLEKNPHAREENEQAATDQVKLAGYVVEVLSDHVRKGERSVKQYRYRLVRESDGAMIIDTRGFYGKKAGRNMMKKAIEAQFELDSRRREEAEPAC